MTIRYMVRSGLLTEMLIVIVVWMKDGIGARVVTNHQPIGGGIVLGISLVVGICYRQHLFRAGEMLLYGRYINDSDHSFRHSWVYDYFCYDNGCDDDRIFHGYTGSRDRMLSKDWRDFFRLRQ